MKLRWSKGRNAGKPGMWVWDRRKFWDCTDLDLVCTFSDLPELVGWVRGDFRDGEAPVYTAYPNAQPRRPIPTSTTLAGAKRELTAYLIEQLLEDD